jgi:hypothetical protein
MNKHPNKPTIKIGDLIDEMELDLFTQIETAEFGSSNKSNSYLEELSEQQLSIQGGLSQPVWEPDN